MRSLLQDFRIQFRVIGALIVRELHTRWGRDNIGFLWVVGEPATFCIAVSIVWTAIRPAHEHGIPVTAFVITGYVPLTLYRHCVGRSIKAFESNAALLFHRHVTTIDILMARILLEICGGTLSGLLVGFGAWTVGYMDPPVNWGLICLGLLCLYLFCIGFALILAGLTEMSDILERFISPVMYVSLPFTGAFSMVDWFGQTTRNVLMYSPMVNCVEMIRSGVFGPNVIVHYDVIYTCWVSCVMILIGTILAMRARRYVVTQ
jgi:capsular polysaccharide transport system permease protein